MKKNIYFYSNLFTWGLVLLLISNYVFGWTIPSQNPPGGNIVLETGATPAGSTGYIQFNDSGNLGADSNLFWDNTNKYLGVGTANPGVKLEVAGDTYINGLFYADYQGVNHFPNGDFETGTTQGFSALTGVTSTDRKDGVYSAYKIGPGTLFSDQYIPIDTDSYLYLEGWFKSIGTGGTSKIYFGTTAYDANKNVLSGNGGTYGYCAASGVQVPTSWTKYTCVLHGEGSSTYQFPVGTKYVRALMLLNYQQSSDYQVRIDGIKYITGQPYELTSGGDMAIMARSGSGNVGIGTTSPGAKLEVAGQLKITGGTPGEGKVLISDSSGLASWETVDSGACAVSGNDIVCSGIPTDSAGTLKITKNGVACPIWKDCDGDGKTYGNGDCDESCSTCYVGRTMGTSAPDGKDQDCDGTIDEVTTPSYKVTCGNYSYPSSGTACNARCSAVYGAIYGGSYVLGDKSTACQSHYTTTCDGYAWHDISSGYNKTCYKECTCNTTQYW